MHLPGIPPGNATMSKASSAHSVMRRSATNFICLAITHCAHNEVTHTWLGTQATHASQWMYQWGWVARWLSCCAHREVSLHRRQSHVRTRPTQHVHHD